MAAGMSWEDLAGSITLNSASARRDLGCARGRAVAFSRSQHRVATYCMSISILFYLIWNIRRDGVSISFSLLLFERSTNLVGTLKGSL